MIAKQVGTHGGNPHGASTRDVASAFRAAQQSGVALVVALMLLVVITLIGLAAVSGTIMQSKMAANQFGRQIAFQNAESALRVAQQRILDHSGEIARDCTATGVTCLSDPFSDPNLPAGSIHAVPVGSSAQQYTAGALTSGQPEYVIEDMGEWLDATAGMGQGRTAGAHNYPGAHAQPVQYYRITARSSDPTEIGERAVVVLQAVVKQG